MKLKLSKSNERNFFIYVAYKNGSRPPTGWLSYQYRMPGGEVPTAPLGMPPLITVVRSRDVAMDHLI